MPDSQVKQGANVNGTAANHAVPFSKDASLRLRGKVSLPEDSGNRPAEATGGLPPAIPGGQPAESRRTYYDDMSLLSVERLEKISSLFWLAGRPRLDPITKAPLHRLKASGFNFVIFEDAALHLLWSETGMYIKPLPACLIDYDFWQDNLTLADPQNKEIIHGALGLLLSYAWLVRWESDLRIAHELGLLSEDIKYDAWMEFTSSFLATFKRSQISKPWLSWRYDFAEMRLGRINLTWRFRWFFNMKSLIRGYSFGYRVYGSFFERNFGVLLVVFIYLTVVLTAMQLGLATADLQSSQMFQQACLGFAVFCIMVPVVVVGIMLVLFVILFAFNMVATRKNLGRVRNEGSNAT